MLRPIANTHADIDRFVVETDLVAVGAFRCPTSHTRFGDSGPIRNHCIVFPRTSTTIDPDGFRRFVGDQTVVAVYNAGQIYRRLPMSPDGDRCDYFAVAEPVMREVVGRGDPPARHRTDVFAVSHLRARPRWYFRQRQIFRRAAAGGSDAVLAVEEQVLHLVADVASGLGEPSRRADRGRPPTPRQIDIVEGVLWQLARRACESITLAGLAAAAGLSPFHLCRLFRRVTGTTVHRRREQIRLAVALEMIHDGCDLSRVALDVGYSSHSHFTASFRRTYGVTPSRARERRGPVSDSDRARRTRRGRRPPPDG